MIPDQEILAFTFDLLLKISLVLFVALAIDLVWKSKSASQQHFIWATALVVTLLIPFAITLLPPTPVFSYSLERSESVTVYPAQENTNNLASEVTPPGISHRETATAPDLIRESELESATEVGEAAQTDSPQSWSTKALLLPWPLVSFILLAITTFSSWRLRRLAAQTQKQVPGFVRESVERMAKQLKIRPPTIRIGESGAMPMVWGVFKNYLLLPPRAMHWSPQQLRAVLTHELAHLKRRDPAWKLIGLVAQSLYWIHPLVWLANRRMAAAAELASDDCVLRQEHEPSHYAKVLLEMSVPGPEVFQASVAMAQPSLLEKRIRAVLDVRKNRSSIRNVRRWGIAIIIFGCFLGTVSAQPNPEEPETIRQTQASIPGSPDKASDKTETHKLEKKIVGKAIKYLLSHQDKTNPGESLIMTRGRVALRALVYHRLKNLVNKKQTEDNLEQLRSFEDRNTYVVALQTIALCEIDSQKHKKLIQRNVNWLCSAQNKLGISIGGWTYVAGRNSADGSNSRFAVWALAVAHKAGFAVPQDCLQRAAEYWLRRQHDDGGWQYVGASAGAGRTTATMTLSGIACLNMIQGCEVKDVDKAKLKSAIEKAWKYQGLKSRTSGERGHPCYALQIFALASAHNARQQDEASKKRAAADRAFLVDQLSKQQRADGGFVGRGKPNVSSTCLAILALSEIL